MLQQSNQNLILSNPELISGLLSPKILSRLLGELSSLKAFFKAKLDAFFRKLQKICFSKNVPHRPKQFTTRHRFTVSNRLTALRSRQFIINFLRQKAEAMAEEIKPESVDTIGAARLHWITAKKYHKENRIGQRASCILTGRNRSVSGRYNVSRIQIKGLSNAGQLFGARKSSW